MRFELPYSLELSALRARLVSALKEHRDKVEMDWESLTGRFRYWKLGFYGAEGTFAVEPHPGGEGGRIAVVVTKYRGVQPDQVRDALKSWLHT